MKYKHIEASREARLWIGQVIIPAAIVGGMILSNEALRQKIVLKGKYYKNKLKEKFNR